MASVYRRPNSPFWWAAWNEQSADGRLARRAKSTGQKDRSTAMKLALAFEEAASDASKGFLTVDRARSVLSRLTESCGGRKLETLTVRRHFESWLQNKATNLAKRSLQRYELVSRDFLRFLGPRAEIALEHLQDADVITFRDSERKASKSAQTVNLNVKIVRSILEAAHKHGLISRNPAASVEKVEGEAIQRQPFTEAEVRKLVATAPNDEWRGLILLGFYTGGRIGDLAHLCWRNVDLSAGTLTFMPEKTKKRRKELCQPLHQVLHSYLLSLPSSDDDAAPLFPKLARSKTGGEHGLSKGFSRIMAAAGVDCLAVETGFKAKTGGTAKGKARKLSRRSFHSLRHTSISQMANAGVAEEVRRKIVAHADGAVHARYTHHEYDTLRSALAVLPDVS